jgi:hypothetical protein
LPSQARAWSLWARGFSRPKNLAEKFKELRHITKAKQAFLEQKDFEAEQIRIPFWYHATKTFEQHLKPILNPESGAAMIKRSEVIQFDTKLYGGTSFSTTPELAYGRFIVTYGNAIFNKESGRIGKHPPEHLKGRKWRALDRDVEINPEDPSQGVTMIGLGKYKLNPATGGLLDPIERPQLDKLERQERKKQATAWLKTKTSPLCMFIRKSTY